jgi:hypothetical protein
MLKAKITREIQAPFMAKIEEQKNLNDRLEIEVSFVFPFSFLLFYFRFTKCVDRVQ